MELLVDGKWCGKDLCKTRAPQGVGITTIESFIELAKVTPAPDGAQKVSAMVTAKLGQQIPVSQLQCLFQKLSAKSQAKLSDTDIDSLVKFATVDGAGNVDVRRFFDDLFVQ